MIEASVLLDESCGGKFKIHTFGSVIHQSSHRRPRSNYELHTWPTPLSGKRCIILMRAALSLSIWERRKMHLCVSQSGSSTRSPIHSLEVDLFDFEASGSIVKPQSHWIELVVMSDGQSLNYFCLQQLCFFEFFHLPYPHPGLGMKHATSNNTRSWWVMLRVATSNGIISDEVFTRLYD